MGRADSHGALAKMCAYTLKKIAGFPALLQNPEREAGRREALWWERQNKLWVSGQQASSPGPGSLPPKVPPPRTVTSPAAGSTPYSVPRPSSPHVTQGSIQETENTPDLSSSEGFNTSYHMEGLEEQPWEPPYPLSWGPGSGPWDAATAHTHAFQSLLGHLHSWGKTAASSFLPFKSYVTAFHYQNLPCILPLAAEVTGNSSLCTPGPAAQGVPLARAWLSSRDRQPQSSVAAKSKVPWTPPLLSPLKMESPQTNQSEPLLLSHPPPDVIPWQPWLSGDWLGQGQAGFMELRWY